MHQVPEYLSRRQLLACVCGSNRGFTVCRKDRYGLRFRYKLCTKCGHVRTSDPLTDESANQFYSSSDYRSMYFPDETPIEVLKRKTPEPESRTPLLKYVESLGTSEGVILEWGCSGGWNLVPFRDSGWETLGFDYDATYVALGREQLGLNIEIIDDSKTSEIAQKVPDVILLNHVLEHAISPVSLLQRLRSLSSEKTLIVVGVPLLEQITTWHWTKFFHIAHIHYFSTRSLMFVAQEAGLELVDSQARAGLFTFRCAQRVIQPLSVYSRLSVIRSALWLIVGYINIESRIRTLARRFLALMGLLAVARRLRIRLKS